MGIGILFLLLAVALFLASLVMPWVNHARIKSLMQEVDLLKSQLRQVFLHLEKKGIDIPLFSHEAAKEAEPTVQYNAPQPAFTESVASTHESPPMPDVERVAENIREVEVGQESPHYELPSAGKATSSFNIEQHLATRWPVWVGGVALALAGFFLVKYSIEIGLLNPLNRVVLGILFGAGMLFAAEKIRLRSDFSNGQRIAQALSGAGIADLYVCTFAAASLYDIIPPFLGFVGMGAVTFLAVILSIRHGMPIAVLGMVGGFLTPALVSADKPNSILLFSYLYMLLAGIFALTKRQGWKWLEIPVVLFAFAWVIIWVAVGNFSGMDSLYLGLFLLAVTATVTMNTRERYDEQFKGIKDPFSLPAILNFLVICGALLLMAVLAVQGGMGGLEWSMFGLLAIGSITLAYFNQRLYGFAPWAAMWVNAMMLLFWEIPDVETFGLISSIFAILYACGGYVIQSRSEKPALWAGLAAASAIGYYLIGYFKLRSLGIVLDVPSFWGTLAIILAGLAAFMARRAFASFALDHPQRQHVLAVYAAASIAFISIALTIELKRDFLPVAFAAQLLGVAWLSTRLEVKALRPICAILACVFALRLLPQFILLLQLTVYSMVELRLYAVADTVPIVEWPMFQLGVPACLIVAAGYFLRKQYDGLLVKLLEAGAVALLAIMGYYLLRHAFHLNENVLFVKAGFLERGIITNVLYAYALACFWVGRSYSRRAVIISAMVVAGVAAFRTVYFDILIANPLFNRQEVGAMPVINALIINYGLPIFMIHRLKGEFVQAGKPAWAKYSGALLLVLAFAFITLNVRQLYHGNYLYSGITGNAEVYTYSAVWLVFGVTLLLLGAKRGERTLRLASLGIIGIAIGKVFLFDAAELEGLLRVLSFFGLGISLLWLGWFYNRLKE